MWRAHEQVLGGECVLTKTDMEALAAALRAAVKEVKGNPLVTPDLFFDDWDSGHDAGVLRTVNKLLNIADELEAQ